MGGRGGRSFCIAFEGVAFSREICGENPPSIYVAIAVDSLLTLLPEQIILKDKKKEYNKLDYSHHHTNECQHIYSISRNLCPAFPLIYPYSMAETKRTSSSSGSWVYLDQWPDPICVSSQPSPLRTRQNIIVSNSPLDGTKAICATPGICTIGNIIKNLGVRIKDWVNEPNRAFALRNTLLVNLGIED